jgi:catechol 2,3-dioxygenase-like lactoylglutathione lyase family enzyme
MKQEIVQLALVVNDYDEAIQFYTEKLHFTLIPEFRKLNGIVKIF